MRVALITGASSGIGREFALQLYRSGEADFFYIIARRRQRLDMLASELDGKAKIIEADLSRREDIDRIAAILADDKPSVRYLVNAAGYGKFGDWSEINDDDVCGMIDVNVKALVLMTNTVIPYMERGGHIIQMGSASCFTPLPSFNVYASSKAFVLHYTKALKYELRDKKISVTAFCPGWVDTEFLGVAKDKSDVRMPREMKPLLRADRVVRGALKAAKHGRVMYVTNSFTKLQHLLSKILPDCILTKIYLGMLTKPKEKNGKEISK